MNKPREVQTYNKGLFTSMSMFEMKKRDNGKSTLGTGSFGAVHLTNHIQTNSLYAVKIIQGSNITTPYEQEGIEREIKVHFRAKHPNIVKLYDSFQEDDCVHMILEYVSNGNLYNYVQKKKRLDEREACKYFVQTAQALQYLHENNVFHRDIKPENLLIDSNYNIKLCDFGWCAENIYLKRKTFCGTYEYMAPEIVSDVAYDFTIDIWSVGILLYEMLHGYAPFKGKEYKDIAANIKQCQVRYSSSIPADAQELITLILQKDPALRPSFSTIFKSAFVMRNYPNSQKQLRIDQSPKFNFDDINLGKYQSPLQNHQPKGRLNLGNTSEKTITKSINQSNVATNSTSKSKVDIKKILVDIKVQSEQKAPCTTKSALIKNFEDIKRRINFDMTTPLKDTTGIFHNQSTLTSPVFSQKMEDNGGTNRKKNPQSAQSFFCNSTQNSQNKPIFGDRQEKKTIPKSTLLLSQPQLYKSFKTSSANDRKLSFTNQPSTKQSPVHKLNSKSRSGYSGYTQDENICRDFSKKVLSTKTTARKDTRPFLDQYKSLPSEMALYRDDAFFHVEENVTTKSTMTERAVNKFPTSSKDTKSDFNRILKMYMNLCTDSQQTLNTEQK